jgi:hypothetical protein
MHGSGIAFGFTLSPPREKLTQDGRLRQALRAWLRPRPGAGKRGCIQRHSALVWED